MYEYYQNGPLPTWIGWYLQHSPHWFHATATGATLVMELGLIWMILLPRRFRIILFWIVTVWELGVISSANYAFLNYLVLSLGILLVDDRFVLRWIPEKWRPRVPVEPAAANLPKTQAGQAEVSKSEDAGQEGSMFRLPGFIRQHFGALKLAVSAVILTWICYVTAAELVLIVRPRAPLPTTPIVMLQPFRIANQYGLFAVMTHGRYEIEFQGSKDGQNWIAYEFRNKPQVLNDAPGIYAPYQPRFDWNLWFASLGSWTENPIVPTRRSGCLPTVQTSSSSFAETPLPMLHQSRCARCCGNTGLRPWRKSVPQVTGGDGSCSDPTHLRSKVSRMARSA